MHHVCVKTKIFKSGNSKAVRIPASIRLSGPEVEIVDLDENGVLLKELAQPRDSWDLFREGLAEWGASGRTAFSADCRACHQCGPPSRDNNRDEFSRIPRLKWEDWEKHVNSD